MTKGGRSFFRKNGKLEKGEKYGKQKKSIIRETFAQL